MIDSSKESAAADRRSDRLVAAFFLGGFWMLWLAIDTALESAARVRLREAKVRRRLEEALWEPPRVESEVADGGQTGRS